MSEPHDHDAQPAPQEPGSETREGIDIYQMHRLEQLNDDEFWALAREVVRTFDAPMTGIHEQYLECRLRHGKCALPLATLREVVSPPFHISQFPSAPFWMLGVSVWREDILPIIDFEAYLTHVPTDQDSVSQGTGLLLIVSHEDIRLGLYVIDALPIHLSESSLRELSSSLSPYPYLPKGTIKGKVEPETLILDSDILFQHIVHMLTV